MPAGVASAAPRSPGRIRIAAVARSASEPRCGIVPPLPWLALWNPVWIPLLPPLEGVVPAEGLRTRRGAWGGEDTGVSACGKPGAATLVDTPKIEAAELEPLLTSANALLTPPRLMGNTPKEGAKGAPTPLLALDVLVVLVATAEYGGRLLVEVGEAGLLDARLMLPATAPLAVVLVVLLVPLLPLVMRVGRGPLTAGAKPAVGSRSRSGAASGTEPAAVELL